MIVAKLRCSELNTYYRAKLRGSELNHCSRGKMIVAKLRCSELNTNYRAKLRGSELNTTDAYQDRCSPQAKLNRRGKLADTVPGVPVPPPLHSLGLYPQLWPGMELFR